MVWVPEPDAGRLAELERRYSVLLGLDAPQRVDVNPSSVAGLSAAEVVSGCVSTCTGTSIAPDLWTEHSGGGRLGLQSWLLAL